MFTIEFELDSGSIMHFNGDQVDAIKVTENNGIRFVQAIYRDLTKELVYKIKGDIKCDLPEKRALENGYVMYDPSRVLAMEETNTEVWLTFNNGVKIKCVKE